MTHTTSRYAAAMLALVALCTIATPARAQTDSTAARFDTVTTMSVMGATGLTWVPLEVKGFAPGAKMTVIHGDPAGNGDYIIRLQFPDGYKFPEHWHPKAEHLTVMSGSFMLGAGSAESGWKTYAPGDFLYLPARNSHSGGAKGPTVIQLNGMGPFAINLGKP
jgi:quercetin dioxygenase-like cupin family protein